MTNATPDSDVTAELLAFVERTSDLVGVVDAQGRVVYLNEAARKRLGVGDSTGLTTVDLFPPQAFARYYDDVRPALLRTGRWHGDLAVFTGSGEATEMRMTIVARVGPGGEVNGLVTHGREIEMSPTPELQSTQESAEGGIEPPGGDHGATPNASALAADLAVAVSHGLIQPHVQSVVDLNTGVLVGYQGLARWEHPTRGLLEAGQFVESVEDTPMMPVVDLAVLRRTAAAAARTARNGLRVRAYGHVSRRLMSDVGFERYFSEIVEELRIAPSDLCVEIEHAHVVGPSQWVERAVRELRERGVRTVLSGVDGACEVNQIVEYGFEELRLSRGLVRDAGRDATRRRVAHGTIALARALGLTTVAVGIETDAERVDLRDAGCEYGHGTLFGPVQPAGTID